MATFTDRLRIFLDWDGKDADAGIKGFIGKVRDADGAAGKFKAGFGGAFESVKANAGALAVGAGAALAVFGAKAVGAFTDTAKAAIDLGKATGLSTEQASRWIALGDDYGVTAENLAAALGRIGKDLDSAKWEKYGIATRDASGHAKDANTILLDVLEVLNNTEDGAERSRIAAELLGRGWQGIAPILGQTRAEYEDMLSSVEDGQVITEAEAKKAEKWRLAMDKLSDAFGELALQAGETIADLEPLINVLAEIIGLAGKLNDALLGDDLDEQAAQFQALTKAAAESEDALWRLARQYGYADDEIRRMVDASRESRRSYDELSPSAAEAAAMVRDSADAAGAAEYNQRKLKRATDALNDALDEQADAYERAYDGARKYEGTALDVTEAQLDLAEAQAEANEVLNDANSTEADRQRALIDLRRAQMNLNDSVIAQADAYARSTGAQEGSRAYAAAQKAELERLKAVFPELTAEIDAYIRTLGRIPSTVTTNVVTNVGGQAYTGGGNTGNLAPVNPGVGGSRLQGRSSGAPVTVNAYVTVQGGPTNADTARAVVDGITQLFNDGVRAPWMGSA